MTEVALRWKPPSRTDIGRVEADLTPDGVIFASITPGGPPMAFKDTGERTSDGVPIFEYAL